MIECKICTAVFKNHRGLAQHVVHTHEMGREQYFNDFIKTADKVCVCGQNKKFRNINEGYRTFCSHKCAAENLPPTKYWEGKKQPNEMVEKRIKNTNQKQKEITRNKTMIDRYGSLSVNSGCKPGTKMPRSSEHQSKIIESKRRNGTLKHAGGSKISIALLNYYNEGDDQSVTIGQIPTNGRGHKTGRYMDLTFRSSYELIFLKHCEKYNIIVKSCDNKTFRVRYEINGKKKWYYPDFYLPEFDLCIEIKPLSMIDDIVKAKQAAAIQKYDNYCIITEQTLFNENLLHEHILSFRKC